MSLTGSNAVTVAATPSYCGPPARKLLRVPATTCAFVTTIPLPATHPVPVTIRSHAVLRTCSTLDRARSTAGCSAEEVSGSSASTSGPLIDGTSPDRSSTTPSAPCGGTTSTSVPNTAELRIADSAGESPGAIVASAATNQPIVAATNELTTIPPIRSTSFSASFSNSSSTQVVTASRRIASGTSPSRPPRRNASAGGGRPMPAASAASGRPAAANTSPAMIDTVRPRRHPSTPAPTIMSIRRRSTTCYPRSIGAIVSPESRSCCQYSSATSSEPLQTSARPSE